MEQVDIRFHYYWRSVESQPDVKYYFPEKISRHLRAHWSWPAVYRWVVFQSEPGDLKQLYIGEAKILSRRIGNYLNPGRTQQTSQRLNRVFTEEVNNGRKVIMEVLEFETFDTGAISISPADLDNVKVRRFLEGLFILHYQNKGYKVLNA